MAVQTGIEPAISCVTGRHVNRYTTGPLINSAFTFYHCKIKLSNSFESFFLLFFRPIYNIIAVEIRQYIF